MHNARSKRPANCEFARVP